MWPPRLMTDSMMACVPPPQPQYRSAASNARLALGSNTFHQWGVAVFRSTGTNSGIFFHRLPCNDFRIERPYDEVVIASCIVQRSHRGHSHLLRCVLGSGEFSVTDDWRNGSDQCGSLYTIFDPSSFNQARDKFIGAIHWIWIHVCSWTARAASTSSVIMIRFIRREPKSLGISNEKLFLRFFLLPGLACISSHFDKTSSLRMTRYVAISIPFQCPSRDGYRIEFQDRNLYLSIARCGRHVCGFLLHLPCCALGGVKFSIADDILDSFCHIAMLLSKIIALALCGIHGGLEDHVCFSVLIDKIVER